MSAQVALLKLNSPIKDLVIAAQDGGHDFGKSEEDKADVIDWIEKVGQGDSITLEASLSV
jgi:aminoacyl tRNA synthase complex-interacting multifunctional protein 1